MMILVGGEKGGSGKSCLAQNLAVYFARDKKAIVLMVDCDPQRTTSDWIQARNNDPSLPAINCIQLYGKIRNDLLSLAQHYDYMVVDCGGQDNLALRAAMSVADHVVIPLRPKRRDLKTVPHMEDMLSTCKMVNPKMLASFVITQCPSLPNQASRILDAKEVCRSFGINVLNAVTFNRNIYDDSEEQGSSVLENEPEGKAAVEMIAIAEELLAMKPDNNHEFI
jgi:chromosome partitioning protein